MYPRLLLALVCIFVAAGPTDCEHFSTVTVPAVDHKPPLTFGALYDGGEAPKLGAPRSPLRYRVPPGQTGANLLPVAAALDDSSVYGISAVSYLDYDCCNALACFHKASSEHYHEDGGDAPVVQPGDQVSNGRWILMNFAVPTCAAGDSLVSYNFKWIVSEAVDDRGNYTGVDTYFTEHVIEYRR